MTAMGRIYDATWGRGFSALYDRCFKAAEEAGLRDMRREVLAGARGRVLELGAGTGLNLELYPLDVSDLTLVLCTVPDQTATLAEIKRVLKPDGQFLFLEHVRSTSPDLAKWQDRLEKPWRFLGDGCHC